MYTENLLYLLLCALKTQSCKLLLFHEISSILLIEHTAKNHISICLFTHVCFYPIVDALSSQRKCEIYYSYAQKVP